MVARPLEFPSVPAKVPPKGQGKEGGALFAATVIAELPCNSAKGMGTLRNRHPLDNRMAICHTLHNP